MRTEQQYTLLNSMELTDELNLIYVSLIKEIKCEIIMFVVSDMIDCNPELPDNLEFNQ